MSLQVLSSQDAAWPGDTTGTGYRSKGYKLDNNDRPTFIYQVFNTTVNDMSRVVEDGQGIHREITVEKPVGNLYMRLAVADKIESLSENTYLIDDKSYYLRMDDGANKPFIREVNGRKELIVPVQNKISYSILF
jgi:hypothetical protein